MALIGVCSRSSAKTSVRRGICLLQYSRLVNTIRAWEVRDKRAKSCSVREPAPIISSKDSNRFSQKEI